jgi:glutathione S-transferase
MQSLEILGFAASTYVRTARMACIEKSAAYELRPLPFGQPSHFALHPFGKMPVLRHGDFQVFETAAVCSYIDAVFPGLALQPGEARARALMWQWVSAANAYYYPALVAALLSEAPAGEEQGKEAARLIEILESRMTYGSFLAGKTLSLADLFMAPILDFYFSKEDTGRAALEGRPAVAAWFFRIASRKSFQETAAS